MDKLSHINELSGNIFDKTLIDDEDIAFAQKTPYFKEYREYKIKLIAEMEILAEKIAPTQNAAKNMDLWFYIAAEYAFLGNFPEKVKTYASKLDWKSWNPSQSEDAVIYQIFRDLQRRALILNPDLFKTSRQKTG